MAKQNLDEATITDVEHRRLLKIAKQQGVNEDVVLARAIRQYINREKLP
jgi:hypothetical protein